MYYTPSSNASTPSVTGIWEQVGRNTARVAKEIAEYLGTRSFLERRTVLDANKQRTSVDVYVYKWICPQEGIVVQADSLGDQVSIEWPGKVQHPLLEKNYDTFVWNQTLQPHGAKWHWVTHLEYVHGVHAMSVKEMFEENARNFSGAGT